MSTDGRRLLSAIVQSGDLKSYTRMALTEQLFKGGEAVLFDYIYKHVMDYGKIPSLETVQENVDEEAIVPVTEPAEFYYDKVLARYTHNTLKEAVLMAQELLKEQEAYKALEELADKVNDLIYVKQRQHLFDFREVGGLIAEEYKKTKADTGEYTLQFGWPTPDQMAGGIKEGDFISFVGRPASGKTFKLLWGALHNWKRKQVPLFFSMEMMRVVIAQRLAAIHTHKSLTKVLKALMSTKSYNEMFVALENLKSAQQPFWIVDGNLATNVDDIVLLARQLKPRICYVDGAYLIQHKNAKMGKWDRIADNAEKLKQKVATDLGIPVVCSYQLKRETTSKKKEEKLGVEDIYGSDAVGQLSSVVFALLEEESIETHKVRTVDILKGRNGEVGQFKIKWEFEQMDFAELVTDTEQLQFVA